MHFSSILLFIFSIIITFNYTFCLWKKSKEPLESYTIDVLFTNSLTLIRCNIHEIHILRDITIESIGHIKCSNKDSILPEDHIKSITLLQWDQTVVTCSKKKNRIKEEKTYLTIKHKAKNAFKKIKFDLVRVGSVGSSELHINEKKAQLYFKHKPRQSVLTDAEQNEESLSTELYSFKNRPILCRERKFLPQGICSDSSQYQNLSYLCYYKMGVPEPPTVAEMEEELNMLPKDIDLDGDTKIDYSVDKTPVRFPLKTIFVIISIVIFIIVIGIIICCCCCGSEKDKSNSNTSIVSNIS